jgi:ribonuclease HII
MKPRPQPTVEQHRVLRALEEHQADLVIGIDEVGYGAWAGPLVVGGAVVFKDWDHGHCRDSKAFNKHDDRFYSLKQFRSELVDGVVMGMEAPDVDQLGVTPALGELTKEVALWLLQRHPSAVVVQDGDVPWSIPGRDNTNMFWTPGADAVVPAVSAASMLAKTLRDQDMIHYAQVFPEYGFHRHKGYHSQKHVDALIISGPSPIHRFSFKSVAQRVVASEPWQSPRRKTGIHVWRHSPAL